MASYDFDRSHCFFEDVVAFSVPLIGMMALVRFPELKTQIRLLVSRVNVIDRGVHVPPGRISNIVIPDNNAVLGKVVSCTLVRSQVLATELQEGKPVSTLTYVDQDLVSPEPGQRIEYPTPDSILPTVARVTIGSSYERVKDAIEASLGPSPRTWPSLLQYFRHCRNAAFHGNHFNVVSRGGTPGIDASSPPQWRSSTMPDDATMNRMTLIGDLLEAGDVPALLGEVAQELRASGIVL